MRRAAAAIAASGLLAGAAPAGGHPGHTTPVVSVADTAFTPADVTITEGDIVVWTWDGLDTNHSVTADAGQGESFDSGTKHPSGDTFEYFFGKAGTYAYHCTVHASMHGTVTVVPAPPSTVTDTTPPRLSKVRLDVTRRRARVTFTASEGVSVLSQVRRPPAKRVVRDSFRFVKAGRRHVDVRLAGLRKGRYTITLQASDDAANAARLVKLRFTR